MGWFRRNNGVQQPRTLTGARASLTTSHFMTAHPEPHEHTWNVTVWTAGVRDVEGLEAELKGELAALSGKLLNVAIPSGSAEDLARYLQHRMHDICRIDVERENRFLVVHEAEPVNQYAGWGDR